MIRGILAVLAALIGGFYTIFPFTLLAFPRMHFGVDFCLAAILIAIVFGLPCLLFAWNSWFGSLDRAVYWFSIVFGVLSFCMLEQFNLIVTESHLIERWLGAGTLGGFGPFLGFPLLLLLLICPFYLAFRFQRWLKPWLLNRLT